ncbi:MAG TPA: response regulator [Bryobacteraceae bacterium]|nr:response regulator [Bryobacteraceae bacterium]
MSHSILIVDDSAFARRTMRQMLEAGGYDVDEAATGPEALERYALHKPLAVLLDLVMEGMTGLELLAQLRSIDPNVMVVVATADIQTTTRDEAFRLGAGALVNKPFTPDELLAAVRHVTGHGGP